MKKTTTISLAIIALVVIAVVFVLVTKKADAPAVDRTNEETSQPQTSNQEGLNQNSVENASQRNQYTEYDEAKLANSKGDNYLFFHAPWCPQCRAIEDSINAGGHIPDNVTIYKVDYDSNQQLRQKYGVTIQTTFIKVDKDGNFIDKYVAYDEPTIDSVVENFINK